MERTIIILAIVFALIILLNSCIIKGNYKNRYNSYNTQKSYAKEMDNEAHKILLIQNIKKMKK